MSETLKTILMIIFAIGVLILSLRIAGWRVKKACDFIIRDLTEKKAFDPASAVELPYAIKQLINVGLRDYRPRALDELVKADKVRMLEGGRYFLREKHKLNTDDKKTTG